MLLIRPTTFRALSRYTRKPTNATSSSQQRGQVSFSAPSSSCQTPQRQQTLFTQHLLAFAKRQQQRLLKPNKSNKHYLTLLAASLLAGVMSDQGAGKPLSLDEADKLFNADKFDELLNLIEAQPDWQSNSQLLWRAARCKFQIAKKVKDQSKDKYQQLVNSAYDLVKQSLELDDKNGLAHKWAAILLDEVSSLKGTKERVLQVLNVRKHMEKAIEYAPTDATSYYLLGEWHFSCYQVSWWERKLASIAFGKLPDADLEVALKMFEKAEEIEKNFYSKNKLMIAKTLLELKRDKERATALLNEVFSKYASSDKWDDKEAVEEAAKLLK